jgi:predicted ABC-type sugar transport system permease subunit
MATEATTSAATLAATKRKELTRSLIELAGMLPVLIVICILFALLTPNFFDPEQYRQCGAAGVH